jgi:hypothetical protein
VQDDSLFSPSLIGRFLALFKGDRQFTMKAVK